MEDIKLSVIVPCFNEQDAIPIFYGECSKVLNGENCVWEMIFVDDGSVDSSLLRIKELAAHDERVKYVSFSRNFGKEAAMYAGFLSSKGCYVVTMDADLQDPPALLPRMIAALDEGSCDSVATRRSTRTGEPAIRSFFARAFYRFFNRLTHLDILDGARDFRMMKREMVDAILSMTEHNRFSKGIYGWVGFKTVWIEYDNIERSAGQTKWSFSKLFKYALNGIVSFSETPLYVAIWCGAFISLASLVCLIVSAVRTSVLSAAVSLIVLIGGLNIAFIGILGLYMANIYAESKNRPEFIVAESNTGRLKP